MGSGKRIAPQRLGEKLKTIREKLGFSTEEMIAALNCPAVPLHRASITQYEKGRREPPLIVLLQYARLYKTSMETLVDDDLDLS
jgi:transcriptional regulator with XRE-family HTH domain